MNRFSFLLLLVIASGMLLLAGTSAAATPTQQPAPPTPFLDLPDIILQPNEFVIIDVAMPAGTNQLSGNGVIVDKFTGANNELVMRLRIDAVKGAADRVVTPAQTVLLRAWSSTDASVSVVETGFIVTSKRLFYVAPSGGHSSTADVDSRSV